MGEFDGKVALVTGGNSGIGRAAALALAREGAKVVVAARRQPEGQATVRAIAQAGGQGLFVQADLRQRDQIAAMVARVIEGYGRLDVAVNNAGVEGTPFVATAHYDEAVWDTVLAVNLTGVFLCMKHQIPHLLEAGGGAIVNVASVAGLIGGRFGVGYYASKHGVIGLTKATALEYADQNVRVNAVCPAIVRTPLVEKYLKDNPALEAQLTALHPMGRVGTPEEVAEAVVWLCSARSAFTTGHALVLDGGRLIT